MHIAYWWASQKIPLAIRRRKWIILKLILERSDGVGMGWIDLDKNRAQLRSTVNTVTKKTKKKKVRSRKYRKSS
jgi:hypothetical protein